MSSHAEEHNESETEQRQQPTASAESSAGSTTASIEQVCELLQGFIAKKRGKDELIHQDKSKDGGRFSISLDFCKEKSRKASSWRVWTTRGARSRLCNLKQGLYGLHKRQWRVKDSGRRNNLQRKWYGKLLECLLNIEVNGQTYLLNVGILQEAPYAVILGRDVPVHLLIQKQNKAEAMVMTRAQTKNTGQESAALMKKLPFCEITKKRKFNAVRRQEKIRGTSIEECVKPPDRKSVV